MLIPWYDLESQLSLDSVTNESPHFLNEVVFPSRSQVRYLTNFGLLISLLIRLSESCVIRLGGLLSLLISRVRYFHDCGYVRYLPFLSKW